MLKYETAIILLRPTARRLKYVPKNCSNGTDKDRLLRRLRLKDTADKHNAQIVRN